MNARARVKTAEPANEEREILLALFHPATDHKDGCLFKANHNMPCQCGFALVQGRYNWALQRVKAIATAYHGDVWTKPLIVQQEIDNATVRAAACADDIRALGWSVAVHNDYRQNGKSFTFWLVTHPDGRWHKGEGQTDSAALDQIRAAISSGMRGA
jgi:hypothetical protein